MALTKTLKKTKTKRKRKSAPNVKRKPITQELSPTATMHKYPAARRNKRYSIDTAILLCEHISLGNSLDATCRKKGMPTIATFYNWFSKHPEFKDMYTTAKTESADFHADRIVHISEQVLRRGKHRLDHNQARVASDNFKWLASVFQPKKYGKSITLNRGIDYHASEIVDLERMLIESDQRLKRIQGTVISVQDSAPILPTEPDTS